MECSSEKRAGDRRLVCIHACSYTWIHASVSVHACVCRRKGKEELQPSPSLHGNSETIRKLTELRHRGTVSCQDSNFLGILQELGQVNMSENSYINRHRYCNDRQIGIGANCMHALAC